MTAFELRAQRPVILPMATLSSTQGSATTTAGKARPPRVRKALLVALALSIIMHMAWTLWPVDTTTVPEGTVLTATLTEMPPPPVPSMEPAPIPKAAPKPKRPRATPRPPVAAPTVTPDATAPPTEDATATAGSGTSSANGDETSVAPASSTAESTAASEQVPPPVVLPPRVDLAYKVFLGTQGFMIGDATYRFEHSGDRYRISTVGQARGLAALIVRGTGKVESHGRITPNGLRPYEFTVERGSSNRREVAFFDWDAGNVVLHDGATAQLEPPTFDPLTILWQPYFSPLGKADQTFSVATTRRVARYTLTLEAEETITWRRGEIATERWYRRSEDGKTDAWFWLAPSMHYIPIKMRITRTSRGTLEVLLDQIRVDGNDAEGSSTDANDPEAASEPANANPSTVDDITYGMPGSPMMPPIRAEDLRGQ